MRPIGTAQELERRRRRAVELMQRGESPTVVACILGVRRTSLYRWLGMAEKSPEALAAKPHLGPRPRLTAEQLQELERLLLQGAKAHGWRNDLWSARRVAEVVRRRFGVEYHDRVPTSTTLDCRTGMPGHDCRVSLEGEDADPISTHGNRSSDAGTRVRHNRRPPPHGEMAVPLREPGESRLRLLHP